MVQLVILLLMQTPTSPDGFIRDDLHYRVLRLEGTSAATRAELRAHEELVWWSELGEVMLVLTADDSVPGRRLATTPRPEQLIVVSGANDHLSELSGEVLVRSSSFAIVQLDAPPRRVQLDALFAGCHGGWFPLEPNRRLVTLVDPARRKKAKREETARLLTELDATRWFADLYTLQAWDRESRRGDIVDARDWLVRQFAALGLILELEPFGNGTVTNENVLALLRGSSRPDEIYVVGAHYDTTSRRNSSLGPAPGAEDNASGVAAMLEMARLFVAHPPAASILFIGFSGEEQGLVGSRFHVNQILAAGTQGQLAAVLIMDMIAYSSDDRYDILLETSSNQEDLADALVDAALTYTTLEPLISFLPSGSDHVPYIQAGIPAVLVIENEYSTYPGYHRTTDSAEFLGLEQGLEVMKMNVAMLAERVY